MSSTLRFVSEVEAIQYTGKNLEEILVALSGEDYLVKYQADYNGRLDITQPYEGDKAQLHGSRLSPTQWLVKAALTGGGGVRQTEGWTLWDDDKVWEHAEGLVP